MIEPVFNEKALLVNGTLVVADLHIGIEYALARDGIRVPSQTQKMKKRILELLKRTKSRRLILLGDVKHSIPSISVQEYRELPEFLNELSRHADIVVIKGNHDGNIKKIAPDLEVVNELILGDAALCHGSSWLKVEELDFAAIVMGHNHPAISFADRFGRKVKEDAWIRCNFNEKIKRHYILKKNSEIIIMPAFNGLISGTAFNEQGQELLGPYFRSKTIDLENARAYLLDGTFLGAIKDLKTAGIEGY